MSMTTDIMDRLKAETALLHDEAENHPFQRRLVRGELSRRGYVAYLEGMFHLHRTLEALLRDAASHHPIVAAFPLESRFREEALQRDLAHFEVHADQTTPLPAVAHLCEMLREDAAASPTRLLGHLYVLEGSTNGSRFIARAVRRAYQLSNVDGTGYLDPHGEDQKVQWNLFKEQMRALELTAAEQNGIIEAAQSMFTAIMRISEALVESETDENRFGTDPGGIPRCPHAHIGAVAATAAETATL